MLDDLRVRGDRQQLTGTESPLGDTSEQSERRSPHRSRFSARRVGLHRPVRQNSASIWYRRLSTGFVALLCPKPRRPRKSDNRFLEMSLVSLMRHDPSTMECERGAGSGFAWARLVWRWSLAEHGNVRAKTSIAINVDKRHTPAYPLDDNEYLDQSGSDWPTANTSRRIL